MDLISRKSVAGKMARRRDYVGRPSDPDCIIADEPAVPAVPLDKLCEWLGKEGMLAPCYFNQDCDECELKSYWRHKKSECWKQCLTKWMEEQHESN